MAIEIVDFPIKNGDFPYLFVCLPEGRPFRPQQSPLKTGDWSKSSLRSCSFLTRQSLAQDEPD